MPLNDPALLRACVPGCESIDLIGNNEYMVLMVARVGPVSAKFKGRLMPSDIKPPASYSLSFDGQGGPAGFAKGGAWVKLAAKGEETLLSYDVKASVGGKLAQIGSGLIHGAGKKAADDFFNNFKRRFSRDGAEDETGILAPGTNEPEADPDPAALPAAGTLTALTGRTACTGWMRTRQGLEGLVANPCAERAHVPGYGKGAFRRHGWFGLERRRWKNLFDLSDAELEFFELHTAADIEHSNTGWRAVEKFARQLKMEDAAVAACERNLYVWEHYLDGIAAAGGATRR